MKINDLRKTNEWDELDSAASSNLDLTQLKEFYRYKKELKQDGHQWKKDAYDILSGFIWDETEDDSDH